MPRAMPLSGYNPSFHKNLFGDAISDIPIPITGDANELADIVCSVTSSNQTFYPIMLFK